MSWKIIWKNILILTRLIIIIDDWQLKWETVREKISMSYQKVNNNNWLRNVEIVIFRVIKLRMTDRTLMRKTICRPRRDETITIKDQFIDIGTFEDNFLNHRYVLARPAGALRFFWLQELKEKFISVLFRKDTESVQWSRIQIYCVFL